MVEQQTEIRSGGPFKVENIAFFHTLDVRKHFAGIDGVCYLNDSNDANFATSENLDQNGD